MTSRRRPSSRRWWQSDITPIAVWSPTDFRLPTLSAGMRLSFGLLLLVVLPVLVTGGSNMVIDGGVWVASAGVATVATAAFGAGYLCYFFRAPRGAPDLVERDGATVLPESPAPTCARGASGGRPWQDSAFSPRPDSPPTTRASV